MSHLDQSTNGLVLESLGFLKARCVSATHEVRERNHPIVTKYVNRRGFEGYGLKITEADEKSDSSA